MTGLLQRWLAKPRPERLRPRTQLHLESLEARDVPAVTAALNDGGDIVINADANNAAKIVLANVYVNKVHYVRVTNFGNKVKDIRGMDVTNDKVYFYGGSKNDVFDDNTGWLRVIALGNGGADTIYGGQYDDTLYGGDGNDKIYGEGGGDLLYGESDSDLLDGGVGDDILTAGDGNDTLKGGDGLDVLYGNEGNDALYGGAGYDTMHGGDGDDFLDGGDDDAWYDGDVGLDMAANQWVINGTTREDVVQQGAPTCSFLATVGAVASRNDMTYYIDYLGDSQYDVYLFNGTSWAPNKVKFDGWTHGADASVTANGDVNAANEACEGEFWVTLMQRGMQKMKGVNYLDAKAAGKGPSMWPKDAFRLLGITSATEAKPFANIFTGIDDRLLTKLAQKLTANSLVVVAFNGGHPKLVNGSHAYEMTNVDFNTGSITFRNPWGIDGGTQVDGANDGLIALSFQEFSKLCNYVAYSLFPVR